MPREPSVQDKLTSVVGIVLRVRRNDEEMPGMARGEPSQYVRKDLLRWYVPYIIYIPLPPPLPSTFPPPSPRSPPTSRLSTYSTYPSPQANLPPPPPDALEAATSTLSIDALKRANKDSAKKAAKAAQAEQKHASALAASRIIIKRVERNKRKYVTAVSGLEAFGLELKKVSKDFGKKFATGSSVTKTASGGEEIVVQGDVSTEIEDFLLEKYGDLVPGDNIELVEDKKKKGAGAAPGP